LFVPFLVGIVLAILIALFALTQARSFRQRTLWIGFLAALVAAFLIWDVIELRLEEGTGAFYWRSDWDWDSGGGGVTESVAATALLVGPLVATALAYSAVASWGSRRLRGTRSTAALYIFLVPLALVLAICMFLALIVHPYLFYSSRTS
jgi:hypothetical protein